MPDKIELPTDFETDIKLKRGEFNLHSHGYVGDPKASPEYRVYTEDEGLWRRFKGINGVELNANYRRQKGGLVGYDFIVKAFAIKEVINLLQSEPELFPA